MKFNFIKIFSFILILMFVLSACGTVPSSNDPDSTEDYIDDSSDIAEDSVDSEITEDNSADSETVPDVEDEKKIKNILMIGNSFCYYYVEELYGIAAADGHQINVANLYKSGCLLSEHWSALQNDSKIFEFYIVSDKYRGNRKQLKVPTVKGALEYAKEELGSDWDVIAYQQYFYPHMALNYNMAVDNTMSYAKNFIDYTRNEHPDSQIYWHQHWAFQVGYGIEARQGDTKIPDVATQTLCYENIKAVCQLISEENGVPLVPTGDAWQIARADARIGDVLCARTGTNGNIGDYYHDGDVGGGQYLNACVWYEVLMKESCIGNTWRPSNYELSEEKIVALQEAAHAAVAAVYGEDYAK